MNCSPLDLCVSVVSGGNRQMTLDCLQSLVASLTGALKVEIHFVDNAAPDTWFSDIETLSPLIRVRRNSYRKGFGRNHNEVISSVDADFYFLLNDDTYVSPGACETLVAEGRRSARAGFVGPRLLNGDRTLQRSCYRYPSPQLALIQMMLLNKLVPRLPWVDDYSHFNHKERRIVEFVSGAALLARKEMVSEVGLFDEQFFMYAEEADWCFRARKAGWQTLFTPEATIVHYGGQSTVNFCQERSVEFLRSHSKFLIKHFGLIGLIAYKICTFFKHLPRFLVYKLAFWGDARSAAESDIVLWSLGLLRRRGLKEISENELSNTRPLVVN